MQLHLALTTLVLPAILPPAETVVFRTKLKFEATRLTSASRMISTSHHQEMHTNSETLIGRFFVGTPRMLKNCLEIV